MTAAESDRINAAYERTGLLGTIPEAKRIAATAQALGVSEASVCDAIGMTRQEDSQRSNSAGRCSASAGMRG